LSGQGTSSGTGCARRRAGWLGPYLAVYLLKEQKWDEASIGVVMSMAGTGLMGFTAMMPETLRHARDEGGGRGD